MARSSFIKDISKVGGITLGGLVGALAIALAVAFLYFGMSSGDVGLIGFYLLLSGSASLVLGLGAANLGLRSAVGIRSKIALAGAVGGGIALVNIIVTALLMFLSSHDLTLLVVLALFSLVIPLFFSFAIAGSITSSIEALTRGAQRLAEGDLSTRLETSSRDEVGDLANALNTMAEELEKSFRRQQDMEQARRDLIASVSHDLRTPLASMRAMIEAITDGVVSDQATIERYWLTLKGEVAHLSNLIDDLFELSRIDAGTLELRLQPSSLEAILANTLESMKSQAGNRALDLKSGLGEQPEPVLVDPHKLQRVLYNLIQNAIRHTPADGTILVEAQTWARWWKCTSRTRGRASPTKTSTTCSTDFTEVKNPAPGSSAGPVWALPSPRASSKRTEAASGSKATPAKAAGSASPCPRPPQGHQPFRTFDSLSSAIPLRWRLC